MEEVLRGRRSRPRHAEHEVEVRGRIEKALREENVSGCEHPVVEDLELRNDPELLQSVQDLPDRGERVLEDLVAKVARAERQRRHLGFELERFDPFLDAHPHRASRRELLQDRAAGTNRLGIEAEGRQVLSRRPVRTAAVNVSERSARLVGATVLFSDFVRQEREVRLLLPGDLGADAGNRDDELVAHVRLRCRSSGTTHVPVARATTRGGSRSRAEDVESDAAGAITLRASNRISRDVRPTLVNCASTSR